MSVKPRTRRVSAKWFYPRDIAEDLGISEPTARTLIRRIPGAERMYKFEGRRGERWHVAVDSYRRWRAANQG